MKRSNVYFATGSTVRLPDFVYFVCEDCATKRMAKLKEKHYTMESLCDFCEKRKKNVHSKDDYLWEIWQISPSVAKKWSCDR